jgi:hypothetical protein
VDKERNKKASIFESYAGQSEFNIKRAAACVFEAKWQSQEQTVHHEIANTIANSV